MTEHDPFKVTRIIAVSVSCAALVVLAMEIPSLSRLEDAPRVPNGNRADAVAVTNGYGRPVQETASTPTFAERWETAPVAVTSREPPPRDEDAPPSSPPVTESPSAAIDREPKLGAPVPVPAMARAPQRTAAPLHHRELCAAHRMRREYYMKGTWRMWRCVK